MVPTVEVKQWRPREVAQHQVAEAGFELKLMTLESLSSWLPSIDLEVALTGWGLSCPLASYSGSSLDRIP
jgi:hypothetical protein